MPFRKMRKGDATEEGYLPITMPYCQHHASPERAWFFRVLEDMKGCDCVLVEFASGLEVWRHNRELNLDHIGRRIRKSELK